MRQQFQLLVFTAAGLLMAGCSSTPQIRTIPPSPTLLRVGVAPNSPPMIFKSGNQFVGVEADLAQALGQALGRQVIFVEENWESLIDSLCDDRIDIIMSSMSITPARSYRITFSDPYLKIGQMALARADEKYKYMSNIAAQAERGVGLKPGTTADFLVRQELPQATRKYFNDGEEAANGLLRKKIDLFISDAPMIWYLASHYESKGLAVTPLVLTQEQLGWGLRRTDTELCSAVNSFLRKAQTSGELNRTFNKWIPGFQ